MYFDKFKGTDFKFINSFSNLWANMGHSMLLLLSLLLLCSICSILINSSVLISNMAIIFQTYCPKLLKQDIFGSRFENCLFCINYYLTTYSKVLTRNVIIALQNSSLQITQSIFVPNLMFFCFCMKLCFDKLEGADNSLSVFQNPILKIYIQIRHFFVLILKFFTKRLCT